MKKLWMMIALLLTAACLLGGCNQASEPPKIVFVDGYVEDKASLFGNAQNGNELPILCIDSHADMEAFNQKAREKCYMVEGTNGELVELPTIDGYNDAVAPYTEEFFQEKSLLVSCVSVRSSPGHFEVTNISIQDGKLSILVDAFAIGVDAAIDSQIIFIEMPKSDLEGVTEFSAKLDVGKVM